MELSQALERRDNSPAGVVASYAGDFATLLPAHIDAGSWVRGAVARIRGNHKLEKAAADDIKALMGALSEAARLGLTPATDEYWLTVRKGKIMGVVGYVGHMELMYRAGAVKAVHAEVVRKADRFAYVPGRDERPTHEIDWTLEDRGPIVLAWAYAVMANGETSRVVVVTPDRIARAKSSSDGASSQYSPWQNDEAKMWLKTAVRDLAKWVPTSVTVTATDGHETPPALEVDIETDGEPAIDEGTGEVLG